MELNGGIRRRSERSKATVGLNAVINAFIRSGDTRSAAKLYRTALTYGMAPNAYIEKRL